MSHLITTHVEWGSDKVDLVEVLLARLLLQNEQVYIHVHISVVGCKVSNCGAEVSCLPGIFYIMI